LTDVEPQSRWRVAVLTFHGKTPQQKKSDADASDFHRQSFMVL
jgi:hypothetical protein